MRPTSGRGGHEEFVQHDYRVRQVLSYPIEPTAGSHRPINLGNPGEFTILKLVQLVRELTGSSSAIEFQPLPSDDPRQRYPDITLARQQFDWQPTIVLARGPDENHRVFRWLAASWAPEL